MTKQATKANRANIQRFNAEFAAGTVKSVCVSRYPHIGGERAEFFRAASRTGGWLVHTESSARSSSDIAIEVSDLWVNKADGVDYDPYNDAAYAQAMLRLSAAVRGVDDYEEGDE